MHIFRPVYFNRVLKHTLKKTQFECVTSLFFLALEVLCECSAAEGRSGSVSTVWNLPHHGLCRLALLMRC